ncbi:MAG: glutamate--tRNA ligase [Steroidobacterales bacterium]
MSAPGVTRFAPSPTGALHLGNARTAFFSWLLARYSGGRFILRVEDTDRERSVEVHTKSLLDELRWLGLAWDEGPDVGGDHGPYLQSGRSAIYATYFAALERAGLTYPCFCSPVELELSRKVQLAAGRPPRYAGTCRALSAVERDERRARGLPEALRFRVPAGAEIAFDDLVHGPQKFLSDDIGDFIIRRAEGTPAFFFCNAVDDSLMGVTQVLRGDDHLANTPRQLMILEALGLRAPGYGHVGLLLGADGQKLSKRHGSTSVGELRETGYLAPAVLNHLFRLGHAPERDGWIEPAEMPPHFAVRHLGRAPARFDEEQLRHWQKLAVERADTHTLESWLAAKLPARATPAERQAFVDLVRHNVVLPADADHWVQVVFGELPPPDAADRALLASAGSRFFDAAVAALDTAGPDIGAITTAVKGATGRKGSDLYLPLRIALTARAHGPELKPLLAIIPPDELRARLAAWSR